LHGSEHPEWRLHDPLIVGVLELGIRHAAHTISRFGGLIAPGENLEYAAIADHGCGRRSEVRDDEERRREPSPAKPNMGYSVAWGYDPEIRRRHSVTLGAMTLAEQRAAGSLRCARRAGRSCPNHQHTAGDAPGAKTV